MDVEGSVPFMLQEMKRSISLIEKLDDFIRRYHQKQSPEGVVVVLRNLDGGGLLFVLLEQVGRFGIVGRTVLFYAFASAAMGLMLSQVVWPVMQWLRLSRGLSYDQAARIVGEHFPEVKDKLLNTLQLQHQVNQAQGADVTLLAASIDQRTASLRALPFSRAVDVRPSRRLLRWAVPAALVVGSILWWQPGWVTEPATRIVQHRTAFVAPAPFQFVLQNTNLEVALGDPLTVEVVVEGQTAAGLSLAGI